MRILLHAYTEVKTLFLRFFRDTICEFYFDEIKLFIYLKNFRNYSKLANAKYGEFIK